MVQGAGFIVQRSAVRVKSLCYRVQGSGLHPVSESRAREVDVRLPGKRNSNSHCARPVHLNHHDDKVDSDQ